MDGGEVNRVQEEGWFIQVAASHMLSYTPNSGRLLPFQGEQAAQGGGLIYLCDSNPSPVIVSKC